MVRVSEIIHRTTKTDIIDALSDENEVVSDVYELYNDVLSITQNYRILPHDMDLHDQNIINDLKHDFNRLYEIISKFPKTSAIYKITDEMSHYFQWF